MTRQPRLFGWAAPEQGVSEPEGIPVGEALVELLMLGAELILGWVISLVIFLGRRPDRGSK